MHWAAAENHGQVVATLLDQNVDVLLETRDGVTPGELAAIRRNYDVFIGSKTIIIFHLNIFYVDCRSLGQY